MDHSKSPERRSGRRHVPRALFWKSRFFAATAPAWRLLSRLESAVLADELGAIEVDRPIFIAGVARSGTTILTEMLSRHPDITAHRYSDFPNMYTPYWRNWLASRTGAGSTEPVERAHRDRIMVTPESPEAVEELIWMMFFHDLHEPDVDQVLTAETHNPEFERFYGEHVRKLLLVRGASRYLAKGNYNLTRLAYILKLYPDARVIVPVRHPVNHIASLIKQDRLFDRLAGEDGRVVRQLRMSGHFEFGPGRRCINIGDHRVAAEIQDCWSRDDKVGGWAGYWSSVYGFALDQVECDPLVRDAVEFVRYEDLCGQPDRQIERLLDHCRLPVEPFAPIRAHYVDQLTAPEYYQPDFSSAEIERIKTIAGSVAARIGYCLDRPE